MHPHLRRSLPWLIAGGMCCSAFFAIFALPNISTRFIHTQSNTLPPILAIAGGHSVSPVSNSLISTLSLAPPLPKPTPIVASMVENHLDSRPQKGLKEALAVFEMIVEGDISRFLALYHAKHLPDVIEPVRSLRPHFVSVAAPYTPLLLHAGGSSIALEALARLPKITSHNAIRYDGETYERDPERTAPHNLMIRSAAIESVLTRSHVPPTPLPLFPVGSRTHLGTPAREVHVSFGSRNHDVTYRYQPLLNTYKRSVEGAPKQSSPANIVILEVYTEGIGDPAVIPWTQTFGTGRLQLFAKGRMHEGHWEREKGAPFRLYDAEGNTLKLERGQVWVMLLPSLSRVKVV